MCIANNLEKKPKLLRNFYQHAWDTLILRYLYIQKYIRTE